MLEYIYLGLVESGEFVPSSSVHLADYPDGNKFNYCNDLVEDIDKVRDICTAALNIRNTHNIRTRQPLSKLTILGKGFDKLTKYFDLIKDEVNVKEIIISHEISKYAKHNLKINFKLVSQRLAHKMKDLVAATKAEKWEKIASGHISICGEELTEDEFSLTLEPTGDNPAFPIGVGSGLVILDTHISKELEYEGIARDVVRLIQQARKKANFHVSDRIVIDIEVQGKLFDSIKAHEAYIMEQTLAKQINYGNLSNKYALIEEHQIEADKFKIGLNKL